MPVCVISTVGPSVFYNAGTGIREQLNDFRAAPGIDITAVLKEQSFAGHELYEAMLAILRTYTSKESLRRASAELNSLCMILEDRKPTNNDTLHFLASETPDGALAARVVGDFCKEHFERKTALHLIEGLQVNDGTRFRWYGLRSLINTLYDILDGTPAGTFTRILNPTGGFKGVVPYLTVVGMIEKEIEVSYIYERSPELITLAGMPLQLDFALLEGAYEALEACEEADMLEEKDLVKALQLKGQPVTHHPAWSLFEVTDIDGKRFYALNGLGQIAYRHLAEGRDRSTVYLSRQAADTYDGFDKVQQKKFATLFDRMGDAGWRKSLYHATKGDAKALKQGNTDERPLIIELDDKTVLVAELTLHSDHTYEKIGDLNRKDYARFRLWEGKK